jgi:ABC-type bacteriocin/lantibiotic exporter with double-glycine peptidase domain
VRVGVVRQSGPADCGIAALEMILTYLGVDAARRRIRELASHFDVGLSAADLIDISLACGIDASGFQIAVSELPELPVPAILHWKRGHFVVLEGKLPTGKYAIVDPAHGRRVMSEGELTDHFSGIAVGFDSAVQVVRGGRSAATEAVCRWLSTVRKEVVHLIASVVAVALAGMATAIFTGRLVEGFVTGPDRSVTLLVPLSLSVAVLAWSMFVARRVGARFSEAQSRYWSKRFVNGVDGASATYVLSRSPRYLLEMAALLDPMSSTASPDGLRTAGLMLVVTQAAIAAVVEWRMACICFVLLLVNVVTRKALSRRRDMLLTRCEELKDFSSHALSASFERSTSFLAAGRLTQRLRRWEESNARARSLTQEWIFPIDLLDGAVSSSGLTMCLIAVVISSIRGSISIATTVTFFLVLPSWSSVVASFFVEHRKWESWKQAVQAITDLEAETHSRLDIELAPPQLGGFHAPSSPLSAAIDFRGVLLERTSRAPVSFAVQRGEVVALVCESEETRARVARVLLGLERPAGGRVTVYDCPVLELRASERAGYIVGTVTDCMFGRGTIADSISGDALPFESEPVREACELLELAKWIDTLPLRELTPINDRGEFTRTRRSRLALAQVLSTPAPVVVIEGVLDDMDNTMAQRVIQHTIDAPFAAVLVTAYASRVPANVRQICL